MKDLGRAQCVLGIQIRLEEKWIILDQSTYIINFLHGYQMENANPVLTPLDRKEMLTPAAVVESRTNWLVIYIWTTISPPSISFGCFANEVSEHVRPLMLDKRLFTNPRGV